MKRISILLFSLLACVGCEILEEDIADDTVQIIAPMNGTRVAAGRIAFRWQQADYAAGYEFRLVAPSFGAAERVAVDSVIYADSLSRSYGCTVELTAGEYQWNVAAFNSGYTTRPEIQTLTVTPLEL